MSERNLLQMFESGMCSVECEESGMSTEGIIILILVLLLLVTLGTFYFKRKYTSEYNVLRLQASKTFDFLVSISCLIWTVLLIQTCAVLGR